MASVTVMRRSGRKFFEVQWIDPDTGNKRTMSTKTNKRRDADRFAGKIEKALANGEAIITKRTTWKTFRKSYEDEVVSKLSPATQTDHRTTLDYIEKHINPRFISSIKEDQISKFQSKLRKKGREEYTIKGHLSNIRRMLRWAKKMKKIGEVPYIEMPTQLTSMRGRPITGEEFERLIDATSAVVGDYRAESFTDIQEGLWWSGLRSSEAMMLHWTDDTNIMVDLTGRRPMFRIQDHAEKARKFRMLPMSPEFAEWLLERTPKCDRVGFVFHPLPMQEPYHKRLTTGWVEKVISKIGEKANVVVSEGKFASAHDFRRAFGFRWAPRVMPAVLKEMMRHADIKTTMQFYVGILAEVAADAAWSAMTNDMANTSGKPGKRTDDMNSSISGGKYD